MKKYISVFEMLTRNTLYKVLAILVIMMAVQVSLFWGEMMERLEDPYSGLELVVDGSYMVIPLAVGFVLITVLLCWSGCNIGSNQGYTLRRLRISEKAVFGLQMIYNMMCYFLLWASQVAVMVGISHMYVQNAKDLTNQTVVLAFYRNNYMHSILPMEDAIGWVVIMVIILVCGVSAAAFTYQQRRGKIGFGILVAVPMVLVAFPRSLNGEFSIFISSCLGLISIAHWVYWGIILRTKEENRDE